MTRTFLKSKIHRATVTQADLHYVGSITIDRDLMKQGDLLPYEKVDIYNVTNGNRLATYVIPGEAGSGVIGINGAAAHLVGPGDIVIIASFVELSDSQWPDHSITTLVMDEKNKVVKTITDSVAAAI